MRDEVRRRCELLIQNRDTMQEAFKWGNGLLNLSAAYMITSKERRASVAQLKQCKELGYLTKLDTNGTNPQVLRQLLEANLPDYVAMDIKNSPSMYAQTCGIPYMDMDPIEESIQYLVSSSLPYEFRTTLVHPLHSDNSILEMGKWLSSLVPEKKPEKLFLQRFQDRDTVVFAGFAAPSEDDILRWKAMLAPYVQDVVIRGK